MEALRHLRLAAALLLSLQGAVAVRAALPNEATCACAANCDCPMHAHAHADAKAAPVDESKLPPCHRHHAKQAPAAPVSDDAPCVRGGCGTMIEPQLGLMAWVNLPEPEARGLLERVERLRHAATWPHEEPDLEDEGPRPRG